MVFDDNDETYTPTSAQLNEQLEAAGQTNLTSDTSDVDFTQTSTGGDFVETGEDDSDPFEDIGIAANKGGLMSTSKKKKKNKK